jgi:cation-transporting P-type ATPase E
VSVPAEIRARGLSADQVGQRLARGESNLAVDVTSRSVGGILKANLLTRFNALLGSLLVVTLIVGPLQDALFGVILVVNALIGVGQELRAKAALDRLAIVTTPSVSVIRDSEEIRIRARDVVLDDMVVAGVGDEVVVDGVLETNSPLEVNEALVTGESTAVGKRRGDKLLAGSFVTAGDGVYRATAVGEATYARKLTTEARRFQLVRSELMGGINQVLRLVTWIIVPTALVLAVSQLRASTSLADAVRGSVAGVITLVPEGLVLLTSAALALAVIRLGRRQVLIQQLAAVEMLARVDVICIDKTGTLTEPGMKVSGVRAIGEDGDWHHALGAMARVETKPNQSMAAVAAYAEDPAWTVLRSIPFSSDRKWSAAEFEGKGWFVAGAPDILEAASAEDVDGRALLLARASTVDSAVGIAGLEPIVIVGLREAVRPSAGSTVELLKRQGVAVKVLSGDHPASVAGVAARLGISTTGAVHGSDLAESIQDLQVVAESSSIFGRVTPEQKRSLVQAMKANGHTVAMLGDGVNDVLALKEAHLGIAMGGGSAAARAVAACVLTDGSFDAMPAIFAEGRRVIGNVERLASLFFTKTVYAFLLAISVGVATVPFPFLPRQLTLISAFTIGIPSVFLALAPNFEPSRTGFLSRVLRFAVPTGAVAGVSTFAAYMLAINVPELSIEEERTVATLVIAGIGLWALARLARPLTPIRVALLVAMASGLIATILLPPARDLFALDFPSHIVLAASAAIVVLAGALLEATTRLLEAGALALGGNRPLWHDRPTS